MNPRNRPLVPAPALLHTPRTSAMGPTPLSTGDSKSQTHTQSSQEPRSDKSQKQMELKAVFYWNVHEGGSPCSSLGLLDERKKGQCGRGSCDRHRGLPPWGHHRCSKKTLPGRRKESRKCESAGERLRGSGRQDQVYMSSFSGSQL